jgi:hypothetical protein
MGILPITSLLPALRLAGSIQGRRESNLAVLVSTAEAAH